MRRAAALVIVCLLPALALSGCWSYRSLSDISIVTGLGVDKDPATGDYNIAAEVVDLTKSIKEGGPGAKLVEARGKTIFGAVRDAKRKLLNRLYFGNVQVVVLSEEVARDVGIRNVADWLLHDAEIRETLNMLVMKGGRAFDLMTLDGLDQPILSLEIDAIISEDNKVTASTAHSEMYQVFGMLNSPGIALTLPAFHIAENNGEKVPEADGIAIFRGDKLAGYLTSEQTKYYLLAVGKAKGGILTIAKDGSGAPDTSLEIAQSQARMAYQITDGRLSFSIETETDVYLAEEKKAIDMSDDSAVKALEKEAGARLQMEIEAVIKKVQAETGSDIYGFGQYLHRHDAKLWHEGLGDRWEEIFRALPVSVSCKVNIKNTSSIRSWEGGHK